MMVDEKFLKEVLAGVKAQLSGEACKVDIKSVTKNNGITLCGMMISKAGEDVSPVIYLDPYFREFKEGMPLEEIISDICLVSSARKCSFGTVSEEMEEFSKIKSRIAYKLINRKKNCELLKDVPYREFLDLAIVYYLVLDINESGQMTAPIHNTHMEHWGVTEEDLYQIASETTPSLLPLEIESMENVVGSFLKAAPGMMELDDAALADLLEEKQPPPYIMTNRRGCLGQ